jgi:hypothetical protein
MKACPNFWQTVVYITIGKFAQKFFFETGTKAHREYNIDPCSSSFANSAAAAASALASEYLSNEALKYSSVMENQCVS